MIQFVLPILFIIVLVFLGIYLIVFNYEIEMMVKQKDAREWKAMRRVYGAVFDIVAAPSGPLTLRLQFSGTTDWVQSSYAAIPSYWKIGDSYDSQLHL